MKNLIKTLAIVAVIGIALASTSSVFAQATPPGNSAIPAVQTAMVVEAAARPTRRMEPRMASYMMHSLPPSQKPLAYPLTRWKHAWLMVKPCQRSRFPPA